ncbi:GNAT family N-acetyltransferase [Arvimicrobium flavum]|uniref:GNAT family N-acetyltransferase n=1 Tax=Arvimicrobium flavum TaxID=3393320 RepID=UPI00237A1571|nr:GNAT family N-acetyltransferase [Mesorhizobium shangrilense]
MILDLGDGFFLRRASVQDHAAFCRICLRTGDAGRDATGREDVPDLMGMIYAVPYQVFEPDFAHAIDGPQGVAGYLLGAPDTQSFNARLAAEWYPKLQKRVADPGPDASKWTGSDWARRWIHHPDLTVPAALAAYPSHGHIDLLPEAQGKGIGRKCMAFLEQRLRQAGSTGMYLDVNPRNEKAQKFYRELGFEALRDERLPETSTFMMKSLR